MFVFACTRACVYMCVLVRACVCVRACVRASCIRAYVCVCKYSSLIHVVTRRAMVQTQSCPSSYIRYVYSGNVSRTTMMMTSRRGKSGVLLVTSLYIVQRVPQKYKVFRRCFANIHEIRDVININMPN
jgi:hypothetical protein